MRLQAKTMNMNEVKILGLNKKTENIADKGTLGVKKNGSNAFSSDSVSDSS